MERICDNSTPCLPCQPTDLCQADCGDPLTNYSAEADDGIDFIGKAYVTDCNSHYLVFQRGQSQAQADDLAQELAVANILQTDCPGIAFVSGQGVPVPDGGGSPNPDPTDPTNPGFDVVTPDSCDPPGGCSGDASTRRRGHRPAPRRHLFGNFPQTCFVECGNSTGSQGFTVAGGAFQRTSQLAADRAAFSYACRNARANLVCFGNPRTPPPGFNQPPSVVIIGNTFKCCSGAAPTFIIPANGKGPFGWSIIAGALPSGMSALASPNTRQLNITGTPDTPGDYLFTVRAQNVLGGFAQQQYQISAIGITTDTLPNATAGQPYNQALAVAGGTDPHSFTLVSGDLPPGLSLAEDGTISGIPICSGSESFTFTVSATDSNGPGCNKTLSISCAGCDWLDGNNPPANPNSWDTMNFQFVSSGGVAPYTFVVIAGTLPDGLSLSLGGLLSGVPSIDQDTTYNYSVEVTDSHGDTCTKNFVMNLKGFCNPLVTKRPRIKTYADNMIAPCPGCSGPIGFEPLWDGTFAQRAFDICPTNFFQQVCKFISPVSPAFRSVMDNGTGSGFGVFSFANLGYFWQPIGGDCNDWYLRIYCFDGVDSDTFWYGKLTLDSLGNPYSNNRTKNPAGTYTRISGCDATPTLQVELY